MLAPAEWYALALLVIVVLALLARAVVELRRSPFTVFQTLLEWTSAILSRTLWGARIDRPLPIPPGQGAVIVCNHTSAVDPWFTQLATRRVVHWMVAAEYFHHPVMNWFFRTVHAIPVSRGGVDTSATKQAIRYAQAGELIGNFPEGRINLTDELLLPGRPGAALIAIKARVPVLPCYIQGAPKCESILGTFVTPARTRLIVGELIDISPYVAREGEPGVLQEMTRRFMKEIAALAGQPDFEPKLAGRKWKPEV